MLAGALKIQCMSFVIKCQLRANAPRRQEGKDIQAVLAHVSLQPTRPLLIADAPTHARTHVLNPQTQVTNVVGVPRIVLESSHGALQELNQAGLLAAVRIRLGHPFDVPVRTQ